ncbi:YciI family protein [Marinicella sp. S1101]|uniref:YciI family protein n=1 Tax=Marinicella marina TaxID=2996016 RepID=UPI002260C364|nr:YciI family protein [Marinicella marina]MCX7553746.1 YciI family protein [Marinicella marina]MDJ1140821.1 YciI family protein [Marinicella marina]
MYFAIMATDVVDSLPLRLPVREQHLARLNELKDAGRLLIAGPHPATDEENPQQLAFTGSLVVAEFDSLHAAQEWADADPYIKAGVYAEVVVKPYLKVLP